MALIILIIFGAVCAAIASTKGRSVVGWFFIGFLTHFIGLILILCLSNLKDEEARRAHIEMENRRLREQIRQEQMKVESLREYTTARLDMHDQHMGIDTRTTAAQLPGGQRPAYMLMGDQGAGQPAQGAPVQQYYPAPQGPAAQVYQPADGAAWYFESNGETHGPVAGNTIRQMLGAGQLRQNTLLWAEHMADWQPAQNIPEFRGMLYT